VDVITKRVFSWYLRWNEYEVLREIIKLEVLGVHTRTCHLNHVYQIPRVRNGKRKKLPQGRGRTEFMDWVMSHRRICL